MVAGRSKSDGIRAPPSARAKISAMPATPDYREIAPSPRLASVIECFWIGHGAGGLHRVTPDGCADILFTGGHLQLVGPMTGWRDFPLTAGQRLFGVRFRPGMWSTLAGAPAGRLTDLLLPMD